MFAYLEKVLSDKGHAVMCVAEGAGQVRNGYGRAGRVRAGAGWPLRLGSLFMKVVACPAICPLKVPNPTGSSTPHPSLASMQDILAAGDGSLKTDASGNPILEDVGPWLKSEMKKYFKDADVKYIGAAGAVNPGLAGIQAVAGARSDSFCLPARCPGFPGCPAASFADPPLLCCPCIADPSYQIRSIPTTSGDRIYCKVRHRAWQVLPCVLLGLGSASGRVAYMCAWNNLFCSHGSFRPSGAGAQRGARGVRWLHRSAAGQASVGNVVAFPLGMVIALLSYRCLHATLTLPMQA